MRRIVRIPDLQYQYDTRLLGHVAHLLAARPGAEEFLQPTLIIVVARHAFDEIRRGNLNLSGRSAFA